MRSRVRRSGMQRSFPATQAKWRGRGIHNMPGTCFTCNRLAVLHYMVTTFLTTTLTSVPPKNETTFMARTSEIKAKRAANKVLFIAQAPHQGQQSLSHSEV